MFSKEEMQQLKKQFWIDFAVAYPKKWILYDTKIKDVSFKFFVDNKIAQVSLEIELKDDEIRKIYFEKIQSLQTILTDEYIPDVILEKDFYLVNGKKISKIWVEKINISLSNKNTWTTIFDFFYHNMSQFELFFFEYEDYIKDLNLNT